MTGPAGPLISVVLPVGNLGDLLAAWLGSVLGEQGSGLEVIAVDDASSGGCGPILDTRAGRDPRLRVIHVTESAGPGPARMRGLAEAAGTYVWFVDPDDLLADGALAAVTGRLASCRPDVLLIDYLIRRVSGRTEPSPGAALLAAPAGAAATLTLAERAAPIHPAMTAWRKGLPPGIPYRPPGTF